MYQRAWSWFKALMWGQEQRRKKESLKGRVWVGEVAQKLTGSLMVRRMKSICHYKQLQEADPTAVNLPRTPACPCFVKLVHDSSCGCSLTAALHTLKPGQAHTFLSFSHRCITSHYRTVCKLQFRLAKIFKVWMILFRVGIKKKENNCSFSECLQETRGQERRSQTD